MALISCLIHKYFRDLHSNSILEILMIFLFGLLTYYIADLSIVGLSGIVAIFVFGIMQSHYNRYNLSEDAEEKINAVFELLSYACEALIFVYLGLSIGQYTITEEVAIYGIAGLLCMLVCRFIMVFTVFGVIKICKKPQKDDPEYLRHGLLITLSGMIRGSIA